MRRLPSAAIAALLCLAAVPAFAAEADKGPAPRIVSVSGQAEVFVPTTQTRVSLGVEARSKNAQEAQQEAARRSAAVVALLKGRGVEKLQTTGVSLNPEYTWASNKREMVGYMATNTVMFRIDTDKAGTLLDDAVKAGATRIDGLSFVAADEALAAARRDAVRKATQDAQKQADAALEALGLKARDVVAVQVGHAGGFPPPPVFRQAPMAAAKAAEAADTPVVGGEQQVAATVTLQVAY